MHFRISHIRYIWEGLLKNVMSNCVFEIKQDNVLGFASHFVMPFFLPELILSALSDVKHQYKFWKKSPPCVNSGESSSKHKDSKLFVFVSLSESCLLLLTCQCSICAYKNTNDCHSTPGPDPTPDADPTQPCPSLGQLQGLVQITASPYLVPLCPTNPVA